MAKACTAVHLILDFQGRKAKGDHILLVNEITLSIKSIDRLIVEVIKVNVYTSK